jgi:uncharacterized delta-60 repeat protein
MTRNRRPLNIGWGLWLLFAIGPAAMLATGALAQAGPPASIDTSFSDSNQQPGRVLTDFRQLPDDSRSTDVIHAIVLQPDGKIVVAGRSNSPNGDDNFALVRYNSNGVIDTSFGDSTQQPGRVLTDFRTLPDGRRSTDMIHAIALQPDGKIVAAGCTNSPNGDRNFALVRYSANGIIDTSFSDSTQQPGRIITDFRQLPDDSRSTDEAHAIALQPDGKIIAAGHSNSPNGDDNFALVRYHSMPTVGATPGTTPGTTTPPSSPPSTGDPIIPLVLLDPLSIQGGMTGTGTVMLTGPAPAGGIVVKLESSNPAVASVPASVTIPAGATTATFPVTTQAVTTQTTVRITASVEGANNGIVITVQFLVTP